ncbi:MAG: thioredoxin-disulfide reductase [Thermoleophilia bacterium]
MSDSATKSPGPNDIREVVIVGSGPAGLAAGIYCARARLDTVMLDRAMAGGVIAVTELVENFPGFPGGVSGFELADRLKRQAVQFGVELREIDAVTGIQTEDDGTYTVISDEGRLRTRAVILAPGREARRSGIPGEEEFIGRGVSWCATCDGALYRGRTVAVVGGGDSAVEEGMFLTKFADRVYLVHRRDELRAAEVAQERAFCNPKFEFVWDSVPTAILGDSVVRSLEVENVKTGHPRSLPVDGVFFYIGNIPNTGFLGEFVQLDDNGYIVTNELLQTRLPGVYACGDARANALKQIATAVGEGALAAMQAERYLSDLACQLPTEDGAPAGE